ncbi:uncharacterized protein LOC131078173 [Cryptomeria japonica]|uniref:uncharacterized protein LOC131078173 n=1 Tax=Cryptomeria japonica TaxID=3369 RepID=UPI0027DA815B|nr:uncharacterized protein LOC131078173 [Cryptomeria japonica]
MVKPKKTKPKSPSPKPRKIRNATSSFGAQKHVPPPKPQSKPSSGAEKRKKGKPERVYAAATMEEETKSDEVMREVKKSASAARFVKMQSSSEGQTSKKPQVETDPSGITLKKVKETITEQGNLKFLSQFYDRLDEKGKRSLEEATIITNSGEVVQDPPVMNFDSKKIIEEVGDEKVEDAEMGEKEKDEGKIE